MLAGPAWAEADSALVLVHGRGATAEDILDLGLALDLPGVALIAPQAHDFTWYPQRFLAPLEQNQPWLDAALSALDAIDRDLAEAGIEAHRVAWLGFSQGACLVSEWTARHALPRRGIFVLTGGRIGPPGSTFKEAAPSSSEEEARSARPLGGTPVFLGCGDPDPHIPWFRVEETAACFRELGGEVTVRRYPGAPHSVNADEMAFVRRCLSAPTS